MARSRNGAAAVLPARARCHDAAGDNGKEADPKQWQNDFTLLWLDLLEKHGQAARVVDRLAAQTRASSNDQPYRQQHGSVLTDTASLQEAMQSVSELLSSVEEIIRKRLIDDVPAPCTCRTASAADHVKANALDAYLDNARPPPMSPVERSGDDPAFVNSLRGWGGHAPASAPEMLVLHGLELHDAMMRNNLRLVGLHGAHAIGLPNSSSSSAPSPRYSTAGVSLTSTDAHAHAPPHSGPSDGGAVLNRKKRKAAGASYNTGMNTGISTDPNKQPALSRRAVQQKIQTLEAEMVLAVRDGNHVCEYLVQWRGLAQPLWVLRRQCTEQAKQIIDRYNSKRLPRARQASRRRQSTHETNGDSTAATETMFSDEGIFIVDKVVDHRMRYGKKQYLVKWDGYDSSDNTWEAAEKLQADVADVVEAYERKLLAQRSTAGVGASEPVAAELTASKSTQSQKASADRDTIIAPSASGDSSTCAAMAGSVKSGKNAGCQYQQALSVEQQEPIEKTLKESSKAYQNAQSVDDSDVDIVSDNSSDGDDGLSENSTVDMDQVS